MTQAFCDKELAAWVAFDQAACKGLGVRKLLDISEYFGALAPAWEASRSQLQQVPNLPWNLVNSFADSRKDTDPEALLDFCRKQGVTVLPLTHPQYPYLLKQIHDPPAVLYIKGSFHSIDMSRPIGVVGTRRTTAYGQKIAKEFSRMLAENGVTIISGMAVGVDSFAHRGAIEGKGKTIAVLGCGPDVCYPSSNRPLYQMLVDEGHGAVVSEFFPGTKPETWRFPARNRIISGLSDGLLVIEAGQSSGALITADMAFKENRDVYAVPGRIDSPMSEGTNKLIAWNKARLCLSYTDILEGEGWSVKVTPTRLPEAELYGKEKDLYELLTHEPSHFDVLCERSGMQAGELSATLTMLELAGVVTRHPGDWYSRL